MEQSITAYIALGANLGDRQRNLQHALVRLNETAGVRVVRVSSFIDNPSVGGPVDAPPFLNAAAEIETTLDAHALLDRLMKIEREMGRVRGERNAPRPIDLDILLYGGQVIRTESLTVPHPRMHERRFVLQPLAEIAGGVVHPVLKASIGTLLNSLQ